LKSQCLELLMAGGGTEALTICRSQFQNAVEMEAAFSALRLLVEHDGLRKRALAAAYGRWAANPHAFDHWYRVQACAETKDSPVLVAEALRGPEWQWANATRVKAVFDAFCANPIAFHAPDGSGYELVADAVRALGPDNPRLAARFLKAFAGWRVQTANRQAKARESLIDLTDFRELPRELIDLIQTILEGKASA
jgi:aminopeptidase N